MIKKLSCMALVLGLVMGFSSSSAQAISLDFIPSSQGVTVGNPVSVDLVISDLGDMAAPSLSTFDVNVDFDPTILSFNSATYGDPVLGDQLDLFGLGFPITTTTPGLGSVNLFELSFNTDVELNGSQAGSFILATLTFNTFTPGTSSLDIVVNALGDATPLPDGPLPLATDVRNGFVTVRSGTTVIPEPSTWLLFATGFIALLGYGQRRMLAEVAARMRQ